MIKNLTSSSTYVTVQSPYPPNIYNNGMMNVGQVRYNPSTQSMEVYDGNMWQIISGAATIGLSWEADSAVRWAIDKMKEEEELKAKMEKYPALKDAYDQLEMVKALVYGEIEDEHSSI